MALRDSTSFTWTSQEHPLATGEILGALLKAGIDAKPAMTTNQDYTATIEVRAHGKQFAVIVVEIV